MLFADLLSLHLVTFLMLFILVDIVMGYPQQAPLWWKVATARSFVLNRGIVRDIMPATPLEPG